MVAAARRGRAHRPREPGRRPGRPRVGPRRGDRARRHASACSTAASRPTIRSVGELAGAVAITLDEDGGPIADRTRRATLRPRHGLRRRDPRDRARGGDLFRARARRRLHGHRATVLVAGLRAGRSSQGYDVINMSLSTTKRQLGEVLHELADSAYFRRTVLVASAHNMPVESFPWRFSSVISVGSHEEDRPAGLLREPRSAGRVLRARRRRRRRVARRRHDPGHRQQLRHAVHLRHRGADPQQAPAA